MSPVDVNYILWNAKGNAATCDAQGFIQAVGSCLVVFYNCSLNFFYLAVVKYQKTDEYIERKIEPWFHAVPIVTSIAYSAWLLAGKHFNNINGSCISFIYRPRHCFGLLEGEVRDDFDLMEGDVDFDFEFEIPCERGLDGVFLAYITYFVLTVGCPIIVLSSLGSIYAFVRKQEKKNSRYGVQSIRASIAARSRSSAVGYSGRAGSVGGNDVAAAAAQAVRELGLSESGKITSNHRTSPPRAGFHNQRRQSNGFTVNRRSSDFTISRRQSSSDATTTNQRQFRRISSNAKKSTISTQRRSVMHKSVAYSVSYILTWVLTSVILVIGVSGKFAHTSFIYIAHFFGPLQGVFNLLIFLTPKILSAKKGGGKKRSRYRDANKNNHGPVTWTQAFVVAFWSKGGQYSPNTRRRRSAVRVPPTTAEADTNRGDRRNVIQNMRDKNKFRNSAVTSTGIANQKVDTSKSKSNLSPNRGDGPTVKAGSSARPYTNKPAASSILESETGDDHANIQSRASENPHNDVLQSKDAVYSNEEEEMDELVGLSFASIMIDDVVDDDDLSYDETDDGEKVKENDVSETVDDSKKDLSDREIDSDRRIVNFNLEENKDAR